MTRYLVSVVARQWQCWDTLGGGGGWRQLSEFSGDFHSVSKYRKTLDHGLIMIISNINNVKYTFEM
jgi:hypothetical protein